MTNYILICKQAHMGSLKVSLGIITLSFYLKGTSSLFVAISCFLFFVFSSVFLRTSKRIHTGVTGKESTYVFSTLPAAHPILCVVTSKSLLHTDQSTFEKKIKEKVKEQSRESAWKLSPRSYTHQTLSPQLTISFTRSL